jgi:hypothetical protein
MSERLARPVEMLARRAAVDPGVRAPGRPLLIVLRGVSWCIDLEVVTHGLRRGGTLTIDRSMILINHGAAGGISSTPVTIA